MRPTSAFHCAFAVALILCRAVRQLAVCRPGQRFCRLDAPTPDQSTALFEAVQGGHSICVNALLARFPVPDARAGFEQAVDQVRPDEPRPAGHEASLVLQRPHALTTLSSAARKTPRVSTTTRARFATIS